MMDRAGGAYPRLARPVGVLAGVLCFWGASFAEVCAAPIEISTNVVGLRGSVATLEFSMLNLDDTVISGAIIDNIRFMNDSDAVLAAYDIDFEGITSLSEVPAVDTSLTPALVSLVPGGFQGVGTQQVELSEDPSLLIGATVLQVIFDTVPVDATWLCFEIDFEPGLAFSGNGLGADTLTASLFDAGGTAVNTIDPNDDLSLALLSVEGDLPPLVSADPAETQTVLIPEPATAAGLHWLLGVSVVNRRVRRGACLSR